MKTLVAAATLLAAVFLGCDSRTDRAAPPAGDAARETQAGVSPQLAVQSVEHPGLPLSVELREMFSTAGGCAACHSGMSDESGADVSITSFWRSTMMANAARDPFWQASVRAEVMATPAYQAIIEDKCARCHMPMAHVSGTAQDEKSKVLDNGLLAESNNRHALGIDGVSCALCHQIQDTGLGQPSSFSGGYAIDMKAPRGDRPAFGPFELDEDLAALMQSASGFAPVRADHVKRAALCATCHTLYTPYVDSQGQIAGQFPEQVTYLEYLASEYARSQSCQSCHMPSAQGGVPIAIMSSEPKSPFAKHLFVGGNAYMLELLKTFGDELKATASSEHLAATRAHTVDQLQTRTAALAIEELRLDGSKLMAEVAVRPRTGHKLPTGFPARRAWLHVAVMDADGTVVFESGRVNADGSIAGNDNDRDPAAYEPHYARISKPDEVQIYESVMADSEGRVTTTLLRGASYLKDNRLLPAGFDRTNAHADTAVHGRALDDADFGGGRDVITYVVEVGNARGPFTVNAELLYQSIGHRWAQNLRRQDAPEIGRFGRYYDAVPNLPVRISSAAASSEA